MTDRDCAIAHNALVAQIYVGDHDDPTAFDQTRTLSIRSPMPPSDSVSNERPAEFRAKVIGRYTLHALIASGGMASVYLGSLAGAADFLRMVAVKRMHPQISADPRFVARFRDEAWLSARLLHPNIVQTFDVLEWGSELLLIMEYVDGITLRTLCTDSRAVGHRLPLNVFAGILVPVLHGLHAAHEATDDEGSSLGIVHRDFSPHNIIIGRDGHAKILDFGVAKARTAMHVTHVGSVTGKCGYLSPEQILGTEVDRRTDIFAAGIVLWETLTGSRLFRDPDLPEGAILERVLTKMVPAPSQLNPAVPRELDEIVLRALQRNPSDRFGTARELALALEASVPLASPSTVSTCLLQLSGPQLERLSQFLAGTRRRSAVGSPSLADQATEIDARATEVSPASDSTPPPPAPPPSIALPWGRAAILAAPLVLIGMGLFMWAYSHFIGSKAAGQSTVSDAFSRRAQAAAMSSAIPANSIPEISALAPSVPASSSEQGAVTGEETVQLRDAPHPSVRKSDQHRVKTLVRIPPKASVASSSPSCDPPTYLDAEGIRHFKEGCL
jgi:eukaryotic-like serine/threonine-protein kinase